LDVGFNLQANNAVWAVALEADGKILVGGEFTTLGGQTRNHIARLNVDGTLDSEFNPGANDGVLSLAVQADGKVLVGGIFTTLGGQERNRIARLTADGTLDGGFSPSANNSVDSLALQADGKVLVGGSFTMLGGRTRNRIARLDNSDVATQNLTYCGSALIWVRGGSSPEVWRTTFESSMDGTNWTTLGTGSRVPGGWQLVGVSLPANVTVRARGYTTGGNENRSCWFVETTLIIPPQPPPSILREDGRFGVVSNVFSFTVGGVPGQVVVMESSSDLFHWQPVRTNVLESGLWYFTEPDWSTSSHRFFRARNQ
jgi:uncharacterized delta-60 repeat protein